jgi:hypothetical protein
MRPRSLPPLAWITLVLALLAQAAALLWLLGEPERVGERGAPHSALPVLRVAPEAYEATALLGAPLALYAASTLAALLALLALGLGGGARLRAGRGAFTAAAFAIATTATSIAASYGMSPRAAPSFLGLPPASAWLLFGLWPAEALFALVYVRCFATAVWPPASAARFEALLLERRAAERSPEDRAERGEREEQRYP